MKITSGEYFKTQFIIYNALLSAQIVFIAVIILIASGGELVYKFEEYALFFIIGLIIMIIWGIFGGRFFFHNQLKTAKNQNTLIDRLNNYRTGLIIKYAVMEAPGMFSMIAYLLTGEKLFIVLSALIVIIFLTMRPTKEKLIADLELSGDDKDKIENSEAIL